MAASAARRGEDEGVAPRRKTADAMHVVMWRGQDCYGATLRPSLSTPLGNIHDKRVRALIGLNCEGSKSPTIVQSTPCLLG